MITLAPAIAERLDRSIVDGDGRGGAIVTFEGSAELDDTGPRSTELPGYQAKYLPLVTVSGSTAESFARDDPQPVVITPPWLRSS